LVYGEVERFMRMLRSKCIGVIGDGERASAGPVGDRRNGVKKFKTLFGPHCTEAITAMFSSHFDGKLTYTARHRE
jgi:hypothetical protein